MRQRRIYAAIQEAHTEKGYPIELACELLHVARSAYHRWASGKLSRRAAENEHLADTIEKIHEESPDKGYRRLNDDLRRAVEVAQDDKGQIAADLAHIFQPARQCDGLAGVGETKLAAVVRSRLRHGSIPPKIISLKSRSPCSARKFPCGSARPPHPATD